MAGRRDVLKGGLAGAATAALPAAAGAAGAAPALAFAAPEAVTLPITGSHQRFPVRRIYCVGRNYLAHRRELGNSETDPLFFFAKHRDTIVPHGGSCPYPGLTRDYQHEVELVVAMRSGGSDIPAERALDHVFGYAVGLDMTRRDLQSVAKTKQWPWEIGKSFDASAPCGAVTPAAAVGHLTEGRITVSVNDMVRQDSNLANMMWGVAEVIHQLSAQVGLAAGDLIYTGTPDGVGPVRRGDVLVARIDRLSELRVTVA